MWLRTHMAVWAPFGDQRRLRGGLSAYSTHGCMSGCYVFPGLARESLSSAPTGLNGRKLASTIPGYPLNHSFRPQLTVIAVIPDSQCQLLARAFAPSPRQAGRI